MTMLPVDFFGLALLVTVILMGISIVREFIAGGRP